MMTKNLSTTRIVSVLSALTLALSLIGCGGSDHDADDASNTPVFEFRIHGFDAAQAFRVALSDPAVIQQARAQLLLPVADRHLFPIGGIQAGDGGVNAPWHWHFGAHVRLTEMAIELCDSTPTLIEDELDYWLNTVKSYCPWGGYVYAEIK